MLKKLGGLWLAIYGTLVITAGANENNSVAAASRADDAAVAFIDLTSLITAVQTGVNNAEIFVNENQTNAVKREKFNTLMTILRTVSTQLGLDKLRTIENTTQVLRFSTTTAPSLLQQKMVIEYADAQRLGNTLFSAPPRALTPLWERMPANTLFAAHGSVKLGAALQQLKTTAFGELKPKIAAEALPIIDMLNSAEPFLNSTNGEWTLIIAPGETDAMPLEFCLTIPDQHNFLFNFLRALWATEFMVDDTTIAFPLPALAKLKLAEQIVLVKGENKIQAMFNAATATKWAQLPANESLATEAQFQQIKTALPDTGIGFYYLSPRTREFTRELLTKLAIPKMDFASTELMIEQNFVPTLLLFTQKNSGATDVVWTNAQPDFALPPADENLDREILQKVQNNLDRDGWLYNFTNFRLFRTAFVYAIDRIRDSITATPMTTKVTAERLAAIKSATEKSLVVFNKVIAVIETSGFYEIIGSGLSAKKMTTPDKADAKKNNDEALSRYRTVVLTNESPRHGWLWKLGNGANKPLAEFAAAFPAETLLAKQITVDVVGIMATLKKCGVLDEEEFNKNIKLLSLTEFAHALTGEFRLVVCPPNSPAVATKTADNMASTSATFDFCLRVPDNDNKLFTAISTQHKNPSSPLIVEDKIIRLTKDATQANCFFARFPQFCLLQGDNVLMLASNPEFVAQIAAPSATLATNPNYQKLAAIAPSSANTFCYVSPQFAAAIMPLMKLLGNVDYEMETTFAMPIGILATNQTQTDSDTATWVATADLPTWMIEMLIKLIGVAASK